MIRFVYKRSNLNERKIKMKKLIILLITAAMLTAMTAGCSDNGGQAPESSTTTAEAPAEPTPEETPDASEDETPEDPEESTAPEEESDSTTDAVLQQIKDAYGEDYLPNMPIDSELLESIYGISPDMYVEYSGEAPMISAHVDTVIIVKAADGKQGDVKAALEAYRSSQVEQSMMYPMNVAKVNASKVEAEGDYVAFLMVGQIDEREDVSDDERATFAEEQVQKAVDVFHNYFKS